MKTTVSKEIQGLKNDIRLKEETLEAEKYMFQRKLINGLGESIMNDLKNPPKPNYWKGLKIRFNRWLTKRKG